MTLLACPFCGVRDLAEFRFRKTVPEPGSSAQEAVYARVNRVHESLEHWQHLGGCRAWLLVRRDPSSHGVLEVRLLGHREGA